MDRFVRFSALLNSWHYAVALLLLVTAYVTARVTVIHPVTPPLWDPAQILWTQWWRPNPHEKQRVLVVSTEQTRAGQRRRAALQSPRHGPRVRTLSRQQNQKEEKREEFRGQKI